VNYWDTKGKTKLVIGNAGKPHPDAVTLDIEALHHPDVVHNISQSPWPFQDNQFTEIICHHVLEHLNDMHPAVDELHRICAPDGKIYIEVPHHTSYYAKSIYHKLYFSYFSFDDLFAAKTDSWQRGKKFELISREVTFHARFRQFFLHKLFNKHPLTYERFWAYIIPAEHVKIVLRPIK
jgi:SAM-dependent methyltransferase